MKKRKFFFLFFICFFFLFFLNKFWKRDLLKVSLGKSILLTSQVIFCVDKNDLTTYCLYKNVCIQNKNIIFGSNTQKFEKINETIPFTFKWNFYERNLDFSSNLSFPIMSFLNLKFQNGLSVKPKWMKGCYSFIGFDWGYENIYHWAKKIIVLFSYKNFNRNNNCENFKKIYIYSKEYSEIYEWQDKFLELTLGLNKTDIIKHNKNTNEIYCFDHLFVPGTSNYLFSNLKESIFFKNLLKTKGINFQRTDIIFLKRKKNRFITNIQEVESYLKTKFGSKIIFLFSEKCTFDQQVKIFSKAKLLIAIHGAGLTNIIFMPPTSVVLEISPPNFFNEVYYRASVNNGLVYFRFTAETKSRKSSENFTSLSTRNCYSEAKCRRFYRDRNFEINLEKFAILLEQVSETL